MKGTVVATWIQTAKTLWGETTVSAAMEKNRWEPTRIFLPLEDIEDSAVDKFMDILSRDLNTTKAKLWYEIGRDNVRTFSKAYPAFFKEKTLYTLHVRRPCRSRKNGQRGQAADSDHAAHFYL